jgi:hypothetical protein
MVERRELPVTYFGKTPFLNIPSFRELLKAREIKALSERARCR